MEIKIFTGTADYEDLALQWALHAQDHLTAMMIFKRS